MQRKLLQKSILMNLIRCTSWYSGVLDMRLAIMSALMGMSGFFEGSLATATVEADDAGSYA
eukprot:3641587-Amphidinium_carterae.1